MNYVLHAIEIALLALIWWNTAPESIKGERIEFTEDQRTQDLVHSVTELVESHTVPPKSDQADAFSVDRKPRHLPWSVRRKQKEDAARTTRKKLEEFKDA